MHFDIASLLGIAALAIGSFFGHLIVKPKDHEVAQHLDTIATGAAALAASMYPDAKWPKLLEETVRQIASAAGVPTQNGKAIERAAAAALTALGKNGAQ